MGIKAFTAALCVASCLAGPAFGASSATSSSAANGTSISNANNAGIGNSGATSGSYSGSTSASTGGNGSANGSSVVNFTYNDPNGAGAGGDPTENINQRLVTVGTAIAPSIYNNNLCALGMSAAGGFMGGAFAFGLDRVDKGCDQRATAALLGHFAEIYAIQSRTASDPAVRQQAALASATYSRWAVNYLCKMDQDLASTAPPGSGFCPTVATQTGLQVVPAPVAAYQPIPRPPTPVQAQAQRPIVAAVDPPPPKPIYAGPHTYGPHEGGVPSSYRSGPISGYDGPDYSDNGND